MKKISVFYLKSFSFWRWNFRILYLNRRVFVMRGKSGPDQHAHQHNPIRAFIEHKNISTNRGGSDQTEWMTRLILAFAVCTNDNSPVLLTQSWNNLIITSWEDPINYFPTVKNVTGQNKNNNYAEKNHKLVCPIINLITPLWANSADDKLMLFFTFFPRKKALTFRANCLLRRRQFAWNGKAYFLEKAWKIFQNVVCWNFYPACLAWNSIIFLQTKGTVILSYRNDKWLSTVYRPRETRIIELSICELHIIVLYDSKPSRLRFTIKHMTQL